MTVNCAVSLLYVVAIGSVAAPAASPIDETGSDMAVVEQNDLTITRVNRSPAILGPATDVPTGDQAYLY